MAVYFKGLKFIRFMAASLVVIHHTEQFKSIFGLGNYWENGFIRSLGDKGVTLFFVLSGFLITFLLLKEREISGTINIKYFYIRRILRIWPLYFLIVLSSIFIFPHLSFFRMDGTSIVEINFLSVILLSLAILPNITLFKFGAIPFSSQAWSIGVEEQFYLLWPLIIKYVKQIALFLGFIIILLFTLQNCSVIINKLFGNHFMNPITLSKISIFFKSFRIDCMAIGSIGALMVFNKSKALNNLYNKGSSFLIFSLMIGLMLNPYEIPFFSNLIYSVLSMLFIITITTFKDCFYTIENKLFNVLGDVSYGIYMYHPLVCFTLIKLCGTQWNTSILYVAIFTLTLIVSYTSYMLFEKRLIKIKSTKFAIINSN
jgi:peptidoglycan/LPS O-acetylase OafA/YrhL